MQDKPREIVDSRLARPWKRRHDKAIRDAGHDPYRDRGDLPQPRTCSECGASFEQGRWTWNDPPAGAPSTVCPACRRIRDGFPAGYLELSGDFFDAHRTEIDNLIRHQADLEKAEHPLHRIMATEEIDGELHITTTDVHTPRRIGEALKNAYTGTLEFEYADDDTVIRVGWTR